MSVTLKFGADELELLHLQAQPFGYQGDSRDGLTYRAWTVQGMVQPDEWLQLLSIYESWRVLRFNETAARATRNVGTTVLFSGHSFGLDWVDVACWFDEPPSLDGGGTEAWGSASFLLVDAAGAQAVADREDEQADEEDQAGRPDNGTWDVLCEASGESTTVTLTKNPDGWADGPDLSRSSQGSVVIQGPLGYIRHKEIEGHTDEAGWAVIRCWYEAIASRQPKIGEWYPSDPPSMDREKIGTATRCNVSWTMWRVI